MRPLSDIQQVKAMLEALLDDAGHYWAITAYAQGRTEPKPDKPNGDPFILLYGPPYLEHKICRVYEHDFKRLPPYVSTAVSDRAPGNNPKRTEAKEAGRLFECPTFKILTRAGRDMGIGTERRFRRTLWYPTDVPPPLPQTRQRPSSPPSPESRGRSNGRREQDPPAPESRGQAGRQDKIQNKTAYSAFNVAAHSLGLTSDEAAVVLEANGGDYALAYKQLDAEIRAKARTGAEAPVVVEVGPTEYWRYIRDVLKWDREQGLELLSAHADNFAEAFVAAQAAETPPA